MGGTFFEQNRAGTSNVLPFGRKYLLFGQESRKYTTTVYEAEGAEWYVNKCSGQRACEWMHATARSGGRLMPRLEQQSDGACAEGGCALVGRLACDGYEACAHTAWYRENDGFVPHLMITNEQQQKNTDF